jgi:hypothetical protein
VLAAAAGGAGFGLFQARSSGSTSYGLLTGVLFGLMVYGLVVGITSWRSAAGQQRNPSGSPQRTDRAAPSAPVEPVTAAPAAQVAPEAPPAAPPPTAAPTVALPTTGTPPPRPPPDPEPESAAVTLVEVTSELRPGTTPLARNLATGILAVSLVGLVVALLRRRAAEITGAAAAVALSGLWRATLPPVTEEHRTTRIAVVSDRAMEVMRRRRPARAERPTGQLASGAEDLLAGVEADIAGQPQGASR